ncbi:MAG: hypothetical protein JNM57_02230 [Cyclobacteriaceae bacterium]|nr:hypothetical protein [Cyclobacteriaceae bacterium]
MNRAVLFSLFFMVVCWADLIAQDQPKRRLKVAGGLLVILPDTTLITKRDTVLFLTEKERKAIRLRENPHIKSARFYDSLSRKASAYRMSDILDWIVKKKKRKEKLVSLVVKSEDVFQPYAGLTIGSIVFNSVDMIEGSVIDTLQKASTRFGKFVNKVHRDTRSQIIRQNLLFSVGDVVDPYVLADNERLLRQFKTLRDARIYVSKNRQDPAVADVVVVTQDRGSIGVSGSYSSLKKFRFDLYDINMLGYARQLRLSYFRNTSASQTNGYEVTLREPNFFRTFIQGELQHTDNYLRQRTRLTLGRDFLTPETRYAGGFSMYRTFENFYFEEYDTFEISYRENNVDVWAGRSFQLAKRTNLIFCARVNTLKFMDSPFVSPDSNSFFYDRTIFMESFTVVNSNFLKSYRIRGFGRTEDIPIGGSVSLVLGQEVNQFVDRNYAELNGKWGKYFPSTGYFNLSGALGSFFKKGMHEDGLIKISSTYFSDLVKLRNAQMRQFIFATYTRGFNRVLDRTVDLEGKWSVNAMRPIGNERVTLGFETVYFMPWYSYGFQFALFHRFDLNLLTADQMLLTKNSLFPIIRIGTRMVNENLVFPGFSLELAYFGKSGIYRDAWEVKFSVSIPDLFGTSENYKPKVSEFN